MGLNHQMEKAWEAVAASINGKFELEDVPMPSGHRYRLTIETEVEGRKLTITGVDFRTADQSLKKSLFFSRAQLEIPYGSDLNLRVYKMDLLDRLIGKRFQGSSRLRFEDRRLNKKYLAKGDGSPNLQKLINLASFNGLLAKEAPAVAAIKPATDENDRHNILELRVFELLDNPEDIQELVNTCMEMGKVIAA